MQSFIMTARKCPWLLCLMVMFANSFGQLPAVRSALLAKKKLLSCIICLTPLAQQNIQNDMTVHPAKTLCMLSLIKALAGHSVGRQGPKASLCRQQALIGWGIYETWSESSLGTQIIIALLWKNGGYTGFALSFRHSAILSFRNLSN